MRYGIFSDVHSNLEALGEVVSAYKKEGIDRYICAGDVVGYASDPNECVEVVSSIAHITVAGNHDWGAVSLFSPDYFNDIAKEALYWTKNALNESSRSFLESLKLVYANEDLTLTHGTLDAPQDFDYMTDDYTAEKSFAVLGNRVCFLGHVHAVGVFTQDRDGQLRYDAEGRIRLEEGSKYIVNVGSVGQPRDSDPRAAYCVFDTDKNEVQIKRIAYDIDKTRQKIINAGLPRPLGDRLLLGR